MPLAPAPGAVKVTATPETGLPPASLTTALRVAKGVLTRTVCGVPDEAVMVAGGPISGAVKVTATPETGLPPASLTTALRVAKGVLTRTVCGVPDEAVMVAGGP